MGGRRRRVGSRPRSMAEVDASVVRPKTKCPMPLGRWLAPVVLLSLHYCARCCIACGVMHSRSVSRVLARTRTHRRQLDATPDSDPSTYRW